MDQTADVVLSAFAMKTVVSRPVQLFPDVLERLLEAGAIRCSELEVIKHQLEAPETARPVMRALCQAGHLQLLRMALQHHPGLASEPVDDESSTPLHVASRHGQPAAVRMLLDAGADLEAARESDGWTALHEVAACGGGGGPVVAGVLLRAGAQAECSDTEGRTPLQLAAAAGHAATAQLLCSAGADTTAGEQDWPKRPLLLAADTGSVRTVRALLGAGAGGGTDQWGRTALLWAAQLDRSRAVTTLAAAGADVNERDGYKGTPLHWAARRCDEEAVRALLAAGADSTARENDGSTALHLAAWRGRVEVVRLLLETTDVNVRDDAGWTPLHYAAYEGHSAVVRALLEAGADRTARDNEGRTAHDLSSGELRQLLK